MHDQREKAQRDYDWMLSTARSQGINEGRKEGREEGTVIGAIQALQQALGEKVSRTDDLVKQSDMKPKTLLAELQERIDRVWGERESTSEVAMFLFYFFRDLHRLRLTSRQTNVDG